MSVILFAYRYREGNFPENMQDLTLANTSPLDANISFFFVDDKSGDTFLVEPPRMVIPARETGTVTVWAYPKTPGRFTDTLEGIVSGCSEPISFNFACDAFLPSLELDKKMFSFDKVLLHR